jgi:CheY-like chemotaxis protein
VQDEALPIVLLVDDEPRVLSALSRGLRREDVQVETASNGREALARLSAGSVALVISDQKMPGMQGIELLATVRERSPSTARILLTGWSGEIPQAELDRAGLFALIAKPWDDGELRRAVREALAGRG